MKVEERIQFLYSSTSKKAQPLKCSWRIKVSVPLTEIFCRLVLCKANWTAPHIDTGQRVLISKVESGGFVRAVCECSSCQIPIFWVGKLNVDCQISADMSHLFSPFWSPSLSVSILLRPSHHFVLLRLPCVICTLGRLLAMTQNKHYRYFPSNALKLKWRVCFENVRRRKYRRLCSNVVSKSKKFKWTVKWIPKRSTDTWKKNLPKYSKEGFVLLLPTAALSDYSVIQSAASCIHCFNSDSFNRRKRRNKMTGERWNDGRQQSVFRTTGSS